MEKKSPSSYPPPRARLLQIIDVAGRGIDIPTVRYVVNFNVPKAVDDYIHRWACFCFENTRCASRSDYSSCFASVGRTARAGRGGLAVTCVTERDIDLVQAIEARTGVTMDQFPGVVEDEVLSSLNKVNTARRAANLKLVESNFDERDQRHRKHPRKATA